jgi:hypothetical protein
MPADPPEPRSPEGITRRLTKIIWHSNFMHYFWMKKERDDRNVATDSPAQSTGTTCLAQPARFHGGQTLHNAVPE